MRLSHLFGATTKILKVLAVLQQQSATAMLDVSNVMPPHVNKLRTSDQIFNSGMCKGVSAACEAFGGRPDAAPGIYAWQGTSSNHVHANNTLTFITGSGKRRRLELVQHGS